MRGSKGKESAPTSTGMLAAMTLIAVLLVIWSAVGLGELLDWLDLSYRVRDGVRATWIIFAIAVVLMVAIRWANHISPPRK